MKKAKVLLCSLLFALTSFSAYGALPPLFAAAEPAGVEAALGGSLSDRYFEARGGEGLSALGLEARFDWAQNQIVSYGERLTGNYSVSFSLVTAEADWWDLSLYFGAETPNVFTSKTGLFVGHAANGLYAKGVCEKARLYETDGVTEIEDGVNLARDLGGGTAGRKVYYRFEKVNETDFAVYYALTPALGAARCILRFSVPVPDGYFCIAPIKKTERAPFYLYLDDLRIADGAGATLLETDFEGGVPQGLSVDGAGMEVCVPAVLDEGVAYASRFEFEKAAGVYFDASFSYRRFGADAVFGFGGGSLTLGGEQAVVTLSGGKSQTLPAPAGGGEVRVTADGDTLTVRVDGREARFSGVSAAGGVSFAATGAGGCVLSNLTLKGRAEDRVLSVKINEYLLKNAAVGGSVRLAAKVEQVFATGGVSPVFSIIKGGEFAEVAGGVLSLKAAGTVTLQAEAGGKRDVVTFAVAERDFVSYSLNDSFTELNAGNWTARDPRGVLSFHNNVTFTNDRADKSAGYEGAKLVSNVKFLSGGGPLFDLSFSPYVTNAYKGSPDPAEVQKGIDHIRLNKQMSFGVLFGMKSQSAGLAEANYLRLNPPYVELYASGVKQTPISGGTNANSYMDHDDPNFLRLVARADGVLEVYLTNASYGGEELFAAYEGLDMDGYLAFTTNSYGIEEVELPLSFKNVSLTGNVERDMTDFSVLSVRLDKSKLNNAVVSKRPIELSAAVVARPNLTDYHDVRYTVSGGGARVEGNVLYIDTAEPFTLRVTSRYDQSVYDEAQITPKVLEIESIRIRTDELQGLTVYSQPVLLSAVVASNYSYIREFNEVTYEVVSGNAELFTYYSVAGDTYLTQLRVTGPGEVVLRATSTILGDKYDEVRFTVTDPDAQAGKKGCGGSTSAAAAAGTSALVAAAFAAVKRGLKK